MFVALGGGQKYLQTFRSDKYRVCLSLTANLGESTMASSETMILTTINPTVLISLKL